jgi:hypothetical protein
MSPDLTDGAKLADNNRLPFRRALPHNLDLEPDRQAAKYMELVGDPLVTQVPRDGLGDAHLAFDAAQNVVNNLGSGTQHRRKILAGHDARSPDPNPGPALIPAGTIHQGSTSTVP